MGAFPQDWSKSQGSGSSEQDDDEYDDYEEGPPSVCKPKAKGKAKAKAKGKAKARTKASVIKAPPPDVMSPLPQKQEEEDEEDHRYEKEEQEDDDEYEEAEEEPEEEEDEEEEDVKMPLSSSAAAAAAPTPKPRGGGRGRGRGGASSSSSSGAWGKMSEKTKRPGAGTRVRVMTKAVTKSITKGITMKTEATSSAAAAAPPPPLPPGPRRTRVPKAGPTGGGMKVGSRVKFGTKDEGATIVKFVPADVPFPKVVKKRPQGQKRTADRNLNIVNLFKKPAAGRYVVPHAELWTRKPGDLGSGGTSILNVDRGKVPGKAWWEGRTKTYRGYPLNGKPSKDGFSSLEEALVYARTGEDNVTGLTGIDSNILRIAARPGLQDALLNLASRKKARKNGYSSTMMYEALKSTGGDVEAAESLLAKSFRE